MLDDTSKSDRGDLLYKLMEEMKELRAQNEDKLMEELKELRAQNEKFRKIIAQQAEQLKKVNKGKSPLSGVKKSLKKELSPKAKRIAGDRKRKRPNEKAMAPSSGSKVPKEPISNRKKLVGVPKTYGSLLDALSSPSSPAESPKKYARKADSSPVESPKIIAKKTKRIKRERSKSDNISSKRAKVVERQVKKKSSPQNKEPEHQKVLSRPLAEQLSPKNSIEEPSALEMVVEAEEEPMTLPQVELQTERDGDCPLCGQEYCNCSDDEMDFSVSAEESPETFKCEICAYTTSKKEYYLNHIENCDYSGQTATEAKVRMKEKNELQRDNTRVSYKKVMCKHFRITGKCQFGSSCTFKHGKEDNGGSLNHELFPTTETPMIRSPQRFPLTQTSIMRTPIIYPHGPQQDAPMVQNDPRFTIIPRKGKNSRPIYDRESILTDPGVLFLSKIHQKTSDKILLGALRAHLGGDRLELKNHVEINNGCAVVCFKDPNLATQLVNTLPFAVFHRDVEITQGGVPQVVVPPRPAALMPPRPAPMMPPSPVPMRQQVALRQNWVKPRYVNINITPGADRGVVLISGMPSNINSKFLLGALRRHFGGGRVEVTNRIEVNNGSAVVRFKDPNMVDKLMNSLPLKVFEHVLKVVPRSQGLGDSVNRKWNVGFRGLPGVPDQGFNNRRVRNRYDTM